MFFIVLLIILIAVGAARCIRIVPQAQAYVIERLGAYKETWTVGVHFKVPFLDNIALKVPLKEQICDFPPQEVITKDNVTISADSIVYFSIVNPKLFNYGISDPIAGIGNLTMTILRNVIGELELDETLTSRETINKKMRSELDLATDKWGIKVSRVEIKNICPPESIQQTMEKQMKAERERRENILIAEGEKASQILIAEGNKQAKILAAEAEKEAAILEAEAEKERRIREAEGEAEAIRKIQEATANSIKMIKEAGADEAVLTLKSLEAFGKIADGKATKIIIPSDLQGIASLATTFSEVSKKE